MYIRFPFYSGGRTTMRWVHYVAMVIVIVNLVMRLWYAFASRATGLPGVRDHQA